MKSLGDMFCEYKHLKLTTKGKLHVKTDFVFKQFHSTTNV
jgi:hypothetical protein